MNCYSIIFSLVNVKHDFLDVTALICVTYIRYRNYLLSVHEVKWELEKNIFSLIFFFYLVNFILSSEAATFSSVILVQFIQLVITIFLKTCLRSLPVTSYLCQPQMFRCVGLKVSFQVLGNTLVKLVPDI